MPLPPPSAGAERMAESRAQQRCKEEAAAAAAVLLATESFSATYIDSVRTELRVH